MTPAQYLRFEKAQNALIKAIERQISIARAKADKCPPPKKRRPATAKDIRIGAVIWHERPKEDGGDYWNVVEEPLHYGDPFKAYCADDGCRYGIVGAYVELQS